MSKYSIVEYLNDNAGYRCGYCQQKDTNYSHDDDDSRTLNGLRCADASLSNIHPSDDDDDCHECQLFDREYRGRRQGYACGYCGSKATKCSTGMWAHNLSVADYQRLIDRGWRRSGKYVYKPTMDVTCCPQYAIRCPVDEFRMSRSHKKIIKRNNRFFNTGVSPSKQELREDSDCHMFGESVSAHCEQASTAQRGIMNCDMEHTVIDAPTGPDQCSSGSLSMHSTETVSASTVSKPSTVKEPTHCIKNKPKPGKGPDPDKPRCIKAKQLRLQRKLQKQSGLGEDKTTNKKKNEPKTLESLLEEIRSDAAHKIEVRLLRSYPRSLLFEQTFHESYMIYKKYQMVIHNDPAYVPTEKQYTRFLVDSPLEPVYDDEGKHDGYGSFHQQYILDGRIIAVGVLDILPGCVSSVYLYYDPDFSFLSLGTYSALREIGFIRQLHSLVPSIAYYYMGFYIHSCPKMKYKGQYNPSYLLCPETYNWFPIKMCATKLDVNKYSRFDETNKEDEDHGDSIEEVLCLHMRQVMPYIVYKALNRKRDDSIEVREYANLVGMTCAERMLLYRSPPITTSSDDDDDDDDDDD